jgi:hypothetical protein
VPHFEQYTIRVVSSHSIHFHFVHKVFGQPKNRGISGRHSTTKAIPQRDTQYWRV